MIWSRAFLATLIALCVTAALTRCTTFASESEGEAGFWLRQAEAACKEIKEQDAADRAFVRLHAVYIQRADIEKAEVITQQIQNSEQRARAHFAIANHYAEVGNLERCILELNQAKPFAVQSPMRDELVEAYLQLADSATLAIAFINQEPDDQKARERLCEALARHGHLDEALEIAENEKEDKTQSRVKLKTALAAAKAARIEDTERAVRGVLLSNAYQGDAQGIWCELAEALYKKGDLESARKYAARVTDKYAIVTHPDLQRIAKGVPPDAPYAGSSRSKETGALKSELLQTDDPEEAKRILEAALASAKHNPIESTTGQFGPWNQTAQLARLRVGYAYVAALYRQAGNPGEAAESMKIAEEAIQAISKENGFIAMLELTNMYHMQIKMDDMLGLKRATAVTDPRLWLMSVDPIVSKVLASGDVDAAKQIAKRALSAKTGFGSRFDHDRSEVISCFIEAGETQAAHEIVKTSALAELTAVACENAGRAMIKTERGQLMRSSEWQDEIGAFQRAHLSIGAASMLSDSRVNQ